MKKRFRCYVRKLISLDMSRTNNAGHVTVTKVGRRSVYSRIRSENVDAASVGVEEDKKGKGSGDRNIGSFPSLAATWEPYPAPIRPNWQLRRRPPLPKSTQLQRTRAHKRKPTKPRLPTTQPPNQSPVFPNRNRLIYLSQSILQFKPTRILSTFRSPESCPPPPPPIRLLPPSADPAFPRFLLHSCRIASL